MKQAHVGWIAVTLVTMLSTSGLNGQRGGVFRESRDHPAIRYTNGPVNDAVDRLRLAVESGEVSLEFDQTSGYLNSVLDALEIPAESQVTVFSETSFQARWVTPESPRALFFNDTVAVGWVRGADVLEIASLDPTQGVLFYSIDQTPRPRPEIQRNEQCLACHLSWDTLGVPGLMTLNTLPMPDDPNAYAVGWVTDHRSPFEDRWGSWYITGAPPSISHLGNTTEPMEYVPGGRTDPTPVLDTLEGQFDLTGYPRSSSDIVAMMVLEHRNHMTNLLVRLGWEARVAYHSPTGTRSSSQDESASSITGAAMELVDYLLFIDEVPLPTNVVSTSGFGDWYSGQGPFDQQGRSLHQLDLGERLLRYPCSPLIYSAAFDALPDRAREAVYQRLWQVLSGAASDPAYAARLSREDRQAIVEILSDTKPNLPDYFQGPVD